MPRSKWPRKHERPETKRFQEACMAWASQAGVSLNAVFVAAGKARSRKPYWAKERFYGGVIPTEDDIAWARIHAINSVLSTEDLGALYQHRKLVAKFCYSCVGKRVDDITARCWDISCPLRPISPLPLEASRRK